MKQMLTPSNGFSTWNFKLLKVFAHCVIPNALITGFQTTVSPSSTFCFPVKILRIHSVQ